MAKVNILALAILTGVSQFDFAAALYHHHTECTLPNNTTEITFVQNPNVRGTLQIAWLCLFTLFVCTYQVLHLNVPAPRPDGTQSNQFWKTILWAIIVIVAPEFILVESISDLHDARTGLKGLQRASGGVQGSWTLTHMFYADQGGFVVRHREKGDLTISGKLLKGAMERGLIDETTPLSKAEIMDKSKDNPYTKSLAILQIAYFYVEFSLRFVQNLSVTQLELAVASVAVYSLISYACLWHKPKGVGVATVLTALDRKKQQDLETIANMSVFGDISETDSEREEQDWHRQASKSVVSLGRAWTGSSDSKLAILALIFILFSTPLGAVHLIAWNWHFPTVIEMWLWRACGVVATAAGIALLPIGMIAMLISFCWEGFTVVVALPIAGLMVLCYILARLALIAEMIRCLFYLEPGAFVSTDWISILPHIG